MENEMSRKKKNKNNNIPMENVFVEMYMLEAIS